MPAVETTGRVGVKVGAESLTACDNGLIGGKTAGK